jgi:hypothetical protein
MYSELRVGRFTRYLTLALALSSASACGDDDPVEPDPEPEVATMRLTVGATSVTISSNGTQSAPLTVNAGANTVTAAFLRADGSSEPLVTDAEFELQVEPTTPANLTFARTSAFSGTLTISGLTSGQTTTAEMALFHKIEQHEDFGPFPVTLRVN